MSEPWGFETGESIAAQESRFTLDGEAVESIDEFVMSNAFDEETTGLILSLAPGESMLLGGGAGAEFTLRREA